MVLLYDNPKNLALFLFVFPSYSMDAKQIWQPVDKAAGLPAFGSLHK